jgi:predicted RND superfamily exporter protein
MLITLIISFKKPRWVILPMLCCGFSVTVMMGILGMTNWEVTVISSNFISLQLILTMSIAIHLIVRYEELHSQNPENKVRTLVRDTIQDKFIPCLYTTLTTMAGFSSLLLCELKPVRTFGWMMTVGLIISLIITFLFFPAQVMLLKKDKPVKHKKSKFSFLPLLSKLIDGREKFIIFSSAIIIILGLIGISTLKVENSFIDYFKHSTEIYQGLKFIDQKLGGTTPFDVVLKFKNPESNKQTDSSSPSDDIFDEFSDNDQNKPEYWFTNSKIDLIKKVHNYLQKVPHVGKVLSLSTLIEVVEK